MNLKQLSQAAAKHDPSLFKSTELARHAEKALADAMSLHTSDEWVMARFKHVAVFLWLLFTLVTGILAIGGSLKAFDIDPKYFDRLWTVFIVGFAGAVVAVIGAHWKRSE